MSARRISVSAERLDGWLAGFAALHGGATWDGEGRFLTLHGADGSSARCEVPFPPLQVRQERAWGGLVEHALRERTVGVLLVRLGGYAAGVFRGRTLLQSKVGSRPVHGRSAAGGQSQQRFARRRENQATVALEAAAQVAQQVLLPALPELDAVVLGGDRRALRRVLATPELHPLQELATDRVHDVPDPRRRVLESMPERFRAVTITLEG